MALHAPGQRVLITRLGDWEIRRHDERDEYHRYFAARGMLHFQLWSATWRVSVLTPSRLTRGRFEVWRDGVRSALRTWEGVTAHLADIGVPTRAEVMALQVWLIVREETSAAPLVAPRASAALE